MIYKKTDNYILINDKMQNMFDYIEKESLDSIVCDPPYEIGFMGKSWDKKGVAFDVETWRKCYDALKPGGYLLAFGATRTIHRIAVAIEDAGFEIRDQLMYMYGSGFPKSMNIGLAIDKKLGVESEVVGIDRRYNEPSGLVNINQGERKIIDRKIKKVTSEYAHKWNGWGTALKPAFEPIIMARKPFKGTCVDNILKNGVGGINIDECRVEFGNEIDNRIGTDAVNTSKCGFWSKDAGNGNTQMYKSNGRFPSNVILDSEHDIKEDWARYFYTAKASKKDKDEGLDMFEEKEVTSALNKSNGAGLRRDGNPNAIRKNIHPTVKPVELMKYLVRLVTPKGGKIMDCFMGSGSTGKATMFENREREANYYFIGIEMTEEYLPICASRIDYALNKYKYDKTKEEKECKENGIQSIFNYMLE